MNKLSWGVSEVVCGWRAAPAPVGLGLVRKTSSDQLLHFQQAAHHQLNCSCSGLVTKNVLVRLIFVIPLLNQHVKDAHSFFLFFYVYFLCVNNCKCSRATFARCSCVQPGFLNM